MRDQEPLPRQQRRRSGPDGGRRRVRRRGEQLQLLRLQRYGGGGLRSLDALESAGFAQGSDSVYSGAGGSYAKTAGGEVLRYQSERVLVMSSTKGWLCALTHQTPECMTSATPTRCCRSKTGTMQKPSRATWATQRRPFPWTYTVMYRRR